MSSPQRLFPYPGSKWTQARRVLRLLPRTPGFVEPFFGSGAFLFARERVKFELVNDLNGDVTATFQALRDWRSISIAGRTISTLRRDERVWFNNAASAGWV